MKQGFFVTLEGPDGAGKTTQLARLSEKAKEWGIKTVCTREPGGTPVGDAVRKILLEPSFGEMVPLTEVFLYAAARTQLMCEVVLPALNDGKFVLCDRFIDSTLAYQVYGGGMDFRFVWHANLAAIQNRLPDMTFVLDVEPERGLSRRGALQPDRVEQKPLEFHRKVRQGFLALAERFPQRIYVIPGMLPEEEVCRAIWDKVAPKLDSLR